MQVILRVYVINIIKILHDRSVWVTMVNSKINKLRQFEFCCYLDNDSLHFK